MTRIVTEGPIRFAQLREVPLSDLVTHMIDPRVRRHMPLLTGPWGPTEVRTFVEAKEVFWQRDGLGHWAILAGDRYVGWGGFQKEGDEWDYGLVLRPQDFGLGRTITLHALDIARADVRIPYVTFLLPTSRRNTGALKRVGARATGYADYSGVKFMKYRIDTPLIRQLGAASNCR